MIIAVLKLIILWMDVMTAAILYSKDVHQEYKETIISRLAAVKDAFKNYELEQHDNTK